MKKQSRATLEAFSRSAAIYDALYAQKPYAREAKSTALLLRRHGVAPPARLLDLACGTGRHLLEWERLGFSPSGADVSAGMLAVAHHNAAAAGSAARFHHRSFEEVDRIPGRFDAVMCMFSAINYLTPDDALTPFFAKVRARLRRGGVLMLDHWNGFAVLRQLENTRSLRVRHRGLEVLRTAHSRLDAMQQRVEVRYHYLVMRGGVVEQDFEEVHALRFHFPLEMTRALAQAGFTVLAQHPFLQFNRAPNERDFHITVVARA